MSPDIWTRFAAKYKPTSCRIEPWRIVEGQHTNSTRKLVDNSDEQEILESLIDRVKPETPQDAMHLHYLLFTPLRHAPLEYGSRFGKTFERGIFYCSETQDTVFSEAAYYRMLFLDGMSKDPGLVEVDHTVFQSEVATNSYADLTRAPFTAHRAVISSPTDYTVSQAIGSSMRTHPIQAFAFFSARDSSHGKNYGIFAPAAFASTQPKSFQTWRSFSEKRGAEFIRQDHSLTPARFYFGLPQFLMNGKLPKPGLLQR